MRQGGGSRNDLIFINHVRERTDHYLSEAARSETLKGSISEKVTARMKEGN